MLLLSFVTKHIRVMEINAVIRAENAVIRQGIVAVVAITVFIKYTIRVRKTEKKSTIVPK